MKTRKQIFNQNKKTSILAQENKIFNQNIKTSILFQAECVREKEVSWGFEILHGLLVKKNIRIPLIQKNG